MNEQEMIGMFLPDGVLDYFEVKSVEKSKDSFTVTLEEYNKIPKQFKAAKLTSKGFYPQVAIQDFPQRGKPCYLRVKRRRWLNENTGQIVARDWDLVAKGTRMTEEFAAFLKGFVGYQPGKSSLGKYFGVDGKLLELQYVRHLSNYLSWDQLDHASDWVLFPEFSNPPEKRTDPFFT